MTYSISARGNIKIDGKKEERGEESIRSRVREKKEKREKFILLWGRIP